MDCIKFFNIFLILFSLVKFDGDTFLMSQSGQIIPESYQLLFNFSGNDDCPVNQCFYRAEVNITMNITGRADTFLLQSDPKIIIDESRSRLYRIHPNNTLTAIRIVDHIYAHGDVSSLVEIRVEQLFRLMAKHRYLLTLHITREFSDHRGYYHSTPETHANRVLMITFLIPHHAHRVFPCISEQHKWTSSFELTIIHPSSYEVVTGFMYNYRREISPGTTVSVYSPTSKIHSHQFFFAIWSYDYYHIGPMTFWYPPEIDSSHVELMIIYTAKGFKWIVQETNTMHPVRSAMNIALFPGSRVTDFYDAPGVTLFREQRVLFDDEESTTTDKLDILTDISRAIARHWIGIMIYPKDWSDFWVYRALANYVADFIMDEVEPTFRIHDRSLARTILWTRSDRDLNASSTIPFYLFDTWEDKMYFRKEDHITYQVVTIMAMIHEIYNFTDIGNLIGKFIGRWAHDEFGPTPQQMIDELKNEEISQLADSWFENPGTPVVHIALNEVEGRAELMQERFNSFGPWSQSKYSWSIPIRCFDSTNKQYYHEWMLPNKSFSGNADKINVCFLTSGTVVPYRVNYPEKWWYEIIDTLKNNPKDIDEMMRMRIIDDLIELCFAGYIHLEIAFHLLKYLENELDYFPWLAAAKVFQKLRGILGFSIETEYKEYYKQLVVNLIFKVYETLEMTPLLSEDNQRRLHRKNIVNIACGFGHERCLREAEYRLECYVEAVSDDECLDGHCYMQWKKCANDADIRELIFCHGLRRANASLWYSVLQLLNQTNLFHSTRLAISRGLACTENVHILENYLRYVLDDSNLFPSENVFPILLTAARLNEVHAQIVLYFIIKHHDKLIERIQMPHEFHRHINALSEEIYNTDEFNKKKEHDKSLSYAELPESVKTLIEVNTMRANRIRPMIESYLDKVFKKNNK